MEDSYIDFSAYITDPPETENNLNSETAFKPTKQFERVLSKREPFYDSIIKNSTEFDIDPNFLSGSLAQESKFDPNAISPTGAKGIAQFTGATAREVAGLLDDTEFKNLSGEQIKNELLKDPNKAIKYSARYKRALLDMFDGDESKAIAAYNGGPAVVRAAESTYGDKWLENIDKTQAFKRYYSKMGIPLDKKATEIKNHVKSVMDYKSMFAGDSQYLDFSDYLTDPPDQLNEGKSAQQRTFGNAISELVKTAIRSPLTTAKALTASPGKDLPKITEAIEKIGEYKANTISLAELKGKVRGEVYDEMKDAFMPRVTYDEAGNPTEQYSNNINENTPIDKETILIHLNTRKNLNKTLATIGDPVSKFFANLENNPWIKETKMQSSGNKLLDLAYDVTSGLAQVATTAALGKINKKLAVAQMASMISGGAYEKLAEQGIEGSEAHKMVAADVFINTALEKYGMEKVFKLAKPAMGGVFKNLVKSFIASGGDEALQKIPDEIFITMWGETKGKSFEDKVDWIRDNWKRVLSEAGYEGLVGGLTGSSVVGGAQTLNAVSQTRGKQSPTTQSDLTLQNEETTPDVGQQDTELSIPEDQITAEYFDGMTVDQLATEYSSLLENDETTAARYEKIADEIENPTEREYVLNLFDDIKKGEQTPLLEQGDETVDTPPTVPPDAAVNEQGQAIEPTANEETVIPPPETEGAPEQAIQEPEITTQEQPADVPSVQTVTDQTPTVETSPDIINEPIQTPIEEKTNEAQEQVKDDGKNDVQRQENVPEKINEVVVPDKRVIEEEARKVASKFDDIKFVRTVERDGELVNEYEKVYYSRNEKTGKKEVKRRAILEFPIGTKPLIIKTDFNTENLEYNYDRGDKGSNVKQEKKLARIEKQEGDARKETTVARAKELKKIREDAYVEYKPAIHDYSEDNKSGFVRTTKDGQKVFTIKALNDAIEILDRDEKIYFVMKPKLSKTVSRGLDRVIDGVSLTTLNTDFGTDNNNDSESFDNDVKEDFLEEEGINDLDELSEAKNTYNKLKKVVDETFAKDGNTKAYKNKLAALDLYLQEKRASVIGLDERAMKQRDKFIESVEDGDLDGFVTLLPTEDHITKDKKLAESIKGMRFDKVAPGFKNKNKGVEYPPTFQITDIANKTTLQLPLNITAKEFRNRVKSKRVDFLTSDLGKIFTGLEKLPKITFDDLGRSLYGKISSIDGEPAIVINTRTSPQQTIKTVIHEMIGHFGADKVYKEINSDLRNHVRELYQRAKNTKEDSYNKVLDLYGDKDQTQLFDEWVAYNLTQAATEYFDKNGRFNETKFNKDSSIVKKVVESFRKLTEKMLDKLFNIKLSKREINDVFKATLQEMKNIKDTKYTGPKRESKVETKSRTENKTSTKKSTKPRVLSRKEKIERYTADIASLASSSSKGVRSKFYNMVNRHLYSAGMSSYRSQIFDVIDNIKEVGDVNFRKAIELTEEAMGYNDVQTAFKDVENFLKKNSSKLGELIKGKYNKTSTTDGGINVIQNAIKDLNNRYTDFVDYISLKRIYDRQYALKPKAPSHRVDKRVSGETVVYDVVNKKTGELNKSFDNKEDAIKWVRKGIKQEERYIESNSSDKYNRLKDLGYVKEDTKPTTYINKVNGRKTGPEFFTETEAHNWMRENRKERHESGDYTVEAIKDNETYYVLTPKGIEAFNDLKTKATTIYGPDGTQVDTFGKDYVKEELDRIKKAFSSTNEILNNKKLIKDKTMSDAVSEMNKAIVANKQDKPTKMGKMWDTVTQNPIIRSMGFRGLDYDAIHYISRFVDGYRDVMGPVQKWLDEFINDKRDESLSLYHELQDTYKDLLSKEFTRDEIREMTSELYGGTFELVKEKIKRKSKTRLIKLENGETIDLTDSEMVSIFMLARQKDGYETLIDPDGGIVLKGNDDPIIFSPKDVLKINKGLNTKQKKLIGVLDKYFDKQAEIGNRISNEEFGVSIFNEPVYFPLLRNSFYKSLKNQAVESPAEMRQVFLKGSPSITKERKESRNTLRLEDPFLAVARTSEMIKEYAHQVKVVNTLGEFLSQEDFRKSMEKNNFKNQYEQIVNHYDDMRNVKYKDVFESGFDAFNNIFAVSVLGYKPSVAATQPAAAMLFWRELPELTGDEIADLGKVTKTQLAATYNEFNKEIITRNAYLRERKEAGYHKAIIGRSASVRAKDQTIGMDANDILSPKGAMLMTQESDMWTILLGARMVATVAKKKGYVPNSDAYYNYIAKETARIVRRTQQTYDALDSSRISRSKTLKRVALFVSQPLKLHQLLREDFHILQSLKKRYKNGEISKSEFNKKISKKTMDILATIISQAALQELFKMPIKLLAGSYGDDDEWKDWEYWAKTMGINIASFGGIPGIVASAVASYKTDIGGAGVASIFKNLGAMVSGIEDFFSGNGTDKLASGTYKFLKTITYIGGPIEQVAKPSYEHIVEPIVEIMRENW